MNGLYCRLAMTNLKSNRQFYIPYTLIGMISAMLFYSMRAIQGNEGISTMRGTDILSVILTFGIVIIGICVCIFLFYTNGFVMKRRKKELGMLNILGMEKKHIMRVLIWEALILYAVSLGGGLVIGITFNKILTMFLYKLTGLSEQIPFYVSGWGCLQTAQLFGVMYLVMLFYNFMQVRLANPIELLHSNHVGEREPKAKWISCIVGIVCILTGYYLAVSVKGLLEAINSFFIAVILVIIGTYGLFMTVSIAFLKLLRKNKKYYYQAKHFTAVSGMLYRMKQNAVGLANICILSTMVMVAVSTTVCMYAGIEDTLDTEYQGELNFSIYFPNIPNEAQKEYLLEQIEKEITAQGRKMTYMSEFDSMTYVIHWDGNRIEFYDDYGSAYGYTEMGMVRIFTKEAFQKYTNEELPQSFQGGVMVVASPRFESSSIEVFGQAYQVTGIIDLSKQIDLNMIFSRKLTRDMIYVVVESDRVLEQMRMAAKAIDSDITNEMEYEILIDIDGTDAEKKACAEALRMNISGCKEQAGFTSFILKSKIEGKEGYMEVNGGFLFLGLFLGTMFLMITVMIIYYKQISEGYEDRERFSIMTKVGMSRDEVKATIRTQVRTVFFLPITVAVIHLAMAFPMLDLMLMMFGVGNTKLFIWCLVGTAVVFLGLYFAVFRITSQSYYKIVYH